MKTCHRFDVIRRGYEREIGFLSAHSQRYAGEAICQVQCASRTLRENPHGQSPERPRRALPRMRLTQRNRSSQPHPDPVARRRAGPPAHSRITHRRTPQPLFRCDDR